MRPNLALPSAALLVAVAALAGCASDGPPEADPQPPAAFVAPTLDAAQVLGDLKEFSEAHPYRQSGTAAHLAARDDLAARFGGAGLDVVRHTFDGRNILGQTIPGENIIGIKWGAIRDEFIVVGAHYDVTEGAVYGAYDDGSGTAMVFSLAAAYAPVDTTRTILFVAFDMEELGLLGSTAFVEDVASGGFAYPGNVVGMLDLDMIGITWPHPAPMVVWQNSPTLEAWTLELANATGMPAEKVIFRQPFGGSSDGAAFIAAGIPTVYLWSDWDQWVLADGTEMPFLGAYAGAYPWWHKLDTYETMVVEAGSEATLQAGFQTVLDTVSPLLGRMQADVALELAE